MMIMQGTAPAEDLAQRRDRGPPRPGRRPGGCAGRGRARI